MLTKLVTRTLKIPIKLQRTGFLEADTTTHVQKGERTYAAKPLNLKKKKDRLLKHQYVCNMEANFSVSPASGPLSNPNQPTEESCPLLRCTSIPPEVVAVRQLVRRLLDTVARKQSIVWPPEGETEIKADREL